MPRADRPAAHAAAARAIELLAATTSLKILLAHTVAVAGERVLPPDLRRRVPAAFDPLPWSDVERALRDAWDEKPERVLKSIEREPVAVTGAAQVHRGVSGDGEDVAIKVRRPGVTEVIRSDLGLGAQVASLFSGIVPVVDLSAVVGEVRERVLDELDLEHEGEQQRAFARRARRADWLHVPAVDAELTHERVLVSAWVQGESLRSFAASGADAAARLRVAEHVVRFFAGAAGAVGIVHCDPHPDDIVVLPDGGIAVLDYGAVRRVPAERSATALGGLDALIAKDGAGLADAARALGWLPDATPALGAQLVALADALGGPAARGEAALDDAAVEHAIRGVVGREDELLALALGLAVPVEDLWPARMIGQLCAVLSLLGVQADWLALARSALAEGWD